MAKCEISPKGYCDIESGEIHSCAKCIRFLVLVNGILDEDYRVEVKSKKEAILFDYRNIPIMHINKGIFEKFAPKILSLDED